MLGMDRVPPTEVGKRSRAALSDLGKQLNSSTQLVGLKNGQRPRGLKTNDTTIELTGTTIRLGASDSKGQVTEIALTPAVGGTTGITTSTAPPSIADLPKNLDWSFHRDTSSGITYIAINDAGTIRTPTLAGFTGNIPFNRISGTISAAQHGSLTNNATAKHANADGTDAGFMSTGHFTLVDGATAAATVSTLVLRDGGGLINATGYQVNGTQVVAAQGAAIATITATDAGVTYNSDAQTLINTNKATINLILSRLRAHGLIA